MVAKINSKYIDRSVDNSQLLIYGHKNSKSPHDPETSIKLAANKFITAIKVEARNGESTIGQLHQTTQNKFYADMTKDADSDATKESIFKESVLVIT